VRMERTGSEAEVVDRCPLVKACFAHDAVSTHQRSGGVDANLALSRSCQ
jgi:hypothetical protein